MLVSAHEFALNAIDSLCLNTFLLKAGFVFCCSASSACSGFCSGESNKREAELVKLFLAFATDHNVLIFASSFIDGGGQARCSRTVLEQSQWAQLWGCPTAGAGGEDSAEGQRVTGATWSRIQFSFSERHVGFYSGLLCALLEPLSC